MKKIFKCIKLKTEKSLVCLAGIDIKLQCTETIYLRETYFIHQRFQGVMRETMEDILQYCQCLA